MSDLRNAAVAGALTLEQVRAALALGTTLGLENGERPEPEHYWRDEWLEEVNAAMQWWPTDAPIGHAAPMLDQMFRTYWLPVNEGATLLDQLRAAGTRTAAWLAENDLNVVNPNESTEQRTRRLTRERVRRLRQRRGTTPAAPDDEQVASLRRQLAALRAEGGARVAAVREEVALCHGAMMAAVQRHREVRRAHGRDVALLERAVADAGGTASEDATTEAD